MKSILILALLGAMSTTTLAGLPPTDHADCKNLATVHIANSVLTTITDQCGPALLKTLQGTSCLKNNHQALVDKYQSVLANIRKSIPKLAQVYCSGKNPLTLLEAQKIAIEMSTVKTTAQAKCGADSAQIIESAAKAAHTCVWKALAPVTQPKLDIATIRSAIIGRKTDPTDPNPNCDCQPNGRATVAAVVEITDKHCDSAITDLFARAELNFKDSQKTSIIEVHNHLKRWTYFTLCGVMDNACVGDEAGVVAMQQIYTKELLASVHEWFWIAETEEQRRAITDAYVEYVTCFESYGGSVTSGLAATSKASSRKEEF